MREGVGLEVKDEGVGGGGETKIEGREREKCKRVRQ